MRKTLCLTIVMSLAFLASLSARQAAVFKADTASVTVDVAVKRGNNAIANLTAADFRLSDNGVTQVIEAVSIEAVPVDVTLFMDSSGSTEGWRASMQRDILELVRMLRPGDRFRLLTIGDAVVESVPWVEAGATPRVLVPFIRGISLIHDALLYGMVHRAGPGRRHLMVAITDRQDCGSIIPSALLRDLALRTETVIHLVDYTVKWGPEGGRGAPPNHRTRACNPIHGPRTPDVIKEAVERTGGEVRGGEGFFRGPSMVRTFARIFSDFRQSYVLRYTPKGVESKGWHALRVEVPGAPAVTIRARSGYFGSER